MVLIEKLKNLNEFVQEVNDIPESYQLDASSAKNNNNPYSHGLEEIYSIQTVDVQKIRKVSKKGSDKSIVLEASSGFENIEPELDLGLGFRSYIKNTFLDEPIEVLELTSYTLNILLENNIPTLESLKLALENDLSSLPGVGQGHIDEIALKYASFIKNKNEQTRRIDLESLFRVISRHISKESILLLSDKIGLKGLIPWLSKKQNQMKHLNSKNLEKLLEKAYEELKSDVIVDYIKSYINQIAQAFIIPWMNTRNAMASQEEILEYFERHLVKSPHNQELLKFFSQDILGQRFIFNLSIPKVVHEKIWCSSQEQVELLHRLKDLTLTYFYSGHLSYPLELIAQKLEEEFAKSWRECSYYKMVKYFKLSGLFRMQKKEDNKTHVLLSYV